MNPPKGKQEREATHAGRRMGDGKDKAEGHASRQTRRCRWPTSTCLLRAGPFLFRANTAREEGT